MRVSVRRKAKEGLLSGAFVLDPPSLLPPLRLDHAARSASGQHPSVDPSALIVLATNFSSHVVYRFSAFHVLCLPCESLSLDRDQPHKNIPIIIVCDENFHKSLS